VRQINDATSIVNQRLIITGRHESYQAIKDGWPGIAIEHPDIQMIEEDAISTERHLIFSDFGKWSEESWEKFYCNELMPAIEEWEERHDLKEIDCDISGEFTIHAQRSVGDWHINHKLHELSFNSQGGIVTLPLLTKIQLTQIRDFLNDVLETA
jgi:hypothetical protein